MNQRIFELAKQAFQPINDVSTEGVADRYTFEQAWFQMYNQKFAELLIQECINRIEQNRSSGENTDSWTITRDMAFHQMKEDLRKYFGVKE